MSNPASLEDVVGNFQSRLAAGAGEDRTAAARLVDRLSRGSEVKVASETEPLDGLDDLSLEDLIALSEQHLGSAAGSAAEKTASERRQARAQIAAHAFWQELELIKVCNEMGLCRFCKEQPADYGTSICSNCGSEG